MEINKREESGILIVSVSGNLTLAENAAELHQTVRKNLDQKVTPVVVDLSQVPIMDSTGLGQLISIRATTQRVQVGLALVGLHTKVAEVLEITKLSAMFDTYTSPETALKALG